MSVNKPSKREEELRILIEDIWAEITVSTNQKKSLTYIHDLCAKAIDKFAEEDEASTNKTSNSKKGRV